MADVDEFWLTASLRSVMPEVEAGTKFDSEVVNVLVSRIAHYPVGTTVIMDNQTEGVVISQTDDPENPVIMLLDTERKNKKHNLMLEENVSILQVV